MIDLKTTFLKFKNDTISLISCLESEDFDALEGLMNERQALIDEMNSSDFDRQMFIELCEEYEIVKLNSKMHDIMADKMSGIKSEIKKIELSKSVKNNYNTNMAVDSIFFNKKI